MTEKLFLGIQTLFVAFGALVLVPLLTGFDPSVALFTAGVGTLLFHWITKGIVPVFLGSSFAFIPAMIFGVSKWGVGPTLCGLMSAGIVYILLSQVIRIGGKKKLEQILPETITGPIIILIGLILAPVAVNMAMGKTGDGGAVLVDQTIAVPVSMITLLVSALMILFGKKIVRLLPILGGVAAGYLLSLLFGIVDFTPVTESQFFQLPKFTFPQWNWEAVIYILPIAIAPAVEHVGDILAVQSLTGKKLIQNPGLDRTLLGDGVATSVAAFLGGPPNTTYSEVTGSLAVTRNFSPAIMRIAAVTAIVLSFSGTLSGLLKTIPVPVMGGVLVLLFGTIVTVGLQTLVSSKVDLLRPKNLIIVSVIIIFGVGGMTFEAAGFTLKGIGLASIVGIFLNLLLPDRAHTSPQIQT